MPQISLQNTKSNENDLSSLKPSSSCLIHLESGPPLIEFGKANAALSVYVFGECSKCLGNSDQKL